MEAGYGGKHLEDGDYVVYIRVGVTIVVLLWIFGMYRGFPT